MGALFTDPTGGTASVARLRDSPGRWGNDPSFPAEVEWKEATQIENYLGAFATCGDGSGDVIHTRIGNAPSGVLGVASIRIAQGDVEVLEATNGEVILEATTDEWYDLELSAVIGTGTIEIDVHPAGSPGVLRAESASRDPPVRNLER